jgi:hypothetical protein
MKKCKFESRNSSPGSTTVVGTIRGSVPEPDPDSVGSVSGSGSFHQQAKKLTTFINGFVTS